MTNSTKDYAMFKKSIKNTPIDHPNLRRVVASIKERNLLEYRPILVDKDMTVIDGQHRLEAAKILGLPIYYLVEEKLRISDMVRLNANQRHWREVDYFNFYVQSEVVDYIKLKRFMDKCGIGLRSAFAMLGFNRTGDMYEAFKKGEFEFPNDEKFEATLGNMENINTFVDYIVEKTPLKKTIYNTTLIRALGYFFNLENVDFAVFMGKLEFQLKLFHRCTMLKDYLDMFAQIYNWKNQRPISVDGLV